jgi:hypothetical protein
MTICKSYLSLRRIRYNINTPSTSKYICTLYKTRLQLEPCVFFMCHQLLSIQTSSARIYSHRSSSSFTQSQRFSVWLRSVRLPLYGSSAWPWVMRPSRPMLIMSMRVCLPAPIYVKKNFGLINQSSNSLSVLLQAKCIAVLKWSEKVVHAPSLLNDHCPPTFVYCLTTPHLDRRQIIHCEIHAKLSFVVPFGSISCDLRTNTG